MGRNGESYAGAPTGFRRLTPGLLQADRAAERFDGLPEGRRRCHGQLLAAFKAAAPRLGSFAAPGARRRLAVPIHPAAGLGQGRAADCLALGLDAAGGARPFGHAGESAQPRPDRGRADHHEGQPQRQTLRRARPEETRIVEAYGFDLSPIAARHAEFVRLAEEAKAERAEIGRLRRRATIARNGIAQILETAAEYGFDGEEWVEPARATAAACRSLKASSGWKSWRSASRACERRQREARERLEKLLAEPCRAASETVDSDPKGAENGPHYIYLQTKSLS